MQDERVRVLTWERLLAAFPDSRLTMADIDAVKDVKRRASVALSVARPGTSMRSIARRAPIRTGFASCGRYAPPVQAAAACLPMGRRDGRGRGGAARVTMEIADRFGLQHCRATGG